MEHSMASLEEQVRSKEDIIKTLNAELRVYKEKQDILTKLDKEIDKLREKNKALTEKITSRSYTDHYETSTFSSQFSVQELPSMQKKMQPARPVSG